MTRANRIPCWSETARRLVAGAFLVAPLIVGGVVRADRAANPPVVAGHHHPTSRPSRDVADDDGNVIHLKRADIRDDLDDETAGTILCPQGWEIHGGIVWRDNPYDPATMSMTISDPNSDDAMMIYPRMYYNDGVRDTQVQAAQIAGPQVMAMVGQQFAEGNFYNGAEIRKQVQSPEEYFKKFLIPRARHDLQGAKVVSVTDHPELSKILLEEGGNIDGVTNQTQCIRLEYTQDGEAMDEDVYITLTFVPMGQTVVWTAEVVTYRAAHGELDAQEPLYVVMFHSIKLDLKWYAGMMHVAGQMQDNVRRAIYQAGQLSQYMAKRSTEISDDIRKSYEDREAVMDKCNQHFDDAIRSVQPYDSPFQDHPIEVPGGYRRAFTNALGEVIVTNEPSYDPKKHLTGDWREMHKHE